MKQLIQKLAETFGPSGYEDAIREVILAEIKSLADEIRVDSLGNITARKGSAAKNGKRVMLAAHMDEIGLIATHIDEDGFVRFTTVGVPYARYLLGGRIRFVNGVQGVIGSEKLDKSNEIPPTDKMFIDVGATSKRDCPIRVGDVAAFERPFVEMGKRLVAKSLDDRAGVAIAIETLRRLEPGPNEVYFVFTVQEEVGVRGATVSAYGVDPEIGLAIDVTPTGDTPNPVRRDIALGKGPAIKVKDHLMLSDPKVVAWMEHTAQRAKIPTQREVLTGGSTDARAIQVSRTGVPAGGLVLPCRYVHSPSEMIDYDDVENAVKLLTALLSAPIDLG
ncbi:MAG: M42 family metallopeptidase [Anaerolineales bacterium]|nr:M42 family metallopeptidase [Anaerolineales bacterium]